MEFIKLVRMVVIKTNAMIYGNKRRHINWLFCIRIKNNLFEFRRMNFGARAQSTLFCLLQNFFHKAETIYIYI